MTPDNHKDARQTALNTSTGRERLPSPKPDSTRSPREARPGRADEDLSPPSRNWPEIAEELVQRGSRWSGPVILGLVILGIGWLLTGR
ncbi:hypothetical protein [Sphingobium sp. CFD-2]|uniref:hypothetical protein n=1 Tax=Sphingobium sp. CFD-2 TaxID=2878542 RepID=UPI00214CCA22|nr:hypothetical protein [Sphingobium sp. CFD-2]